MKKLLAMLLVICMPVVSMAAVDLSGMTFDELIALREQLNIAIWNSQEWKSVDVPTGVWIVGDDIPAGHWTVTNTEGGHIQVFYCQKIKPAEKKPDHDGPAHTIVLGKNESVDYEMEDGWFFICEGTATFTPYTGKPDLGFK